MYFNCKVIINLWKRIRSDLWRCCSAPSGGPQRCSHVGRDSAAPPPPALIWKRKKTFLYRRNQQPPSCRGSELGFLSNTGFYLETERPFCAMRASFTGKRNLNVASETFWEKKRELDRWSSGRKAPYMWFPLQSAASQPLSPSGSSIVYQDKRRPGRGFRGDLQEDDIFMQSCIFAELRAIFARRNLTSREMGTLNL